MNVPLVSVLMPFLNMERFLQESIDSVLAQTYSNWELLLIDDGSTDGSSEIARSNARQHSARIRYLEHPGHRNEGASASRNLGLAQAEGHYIALLDADDIWLPQKLEQQVAFLEERMDVDLLYGHTEYWFSWTGDPEDRARDYVQSLGIQTGCFYPPASLFNRFFLKPDITTPCTCSLLIRRQLIDRVGGFEDRFRKVFTDQAFYAKLFLFGGTFVADAMWDRYRQHPNSACHVAERTGQLAATRRKFLAWLQEYFRSQGIQGELARQLRRARLLAEYPTLERLAALPRQSQTFARRCQRALARCGRRFPGAPGGLPIKDAAHLKQKS